jgi:hypothetical protein
MLDACPPCLGPYGRSRVGHRPVCGVAGPTDRRRRVAELVAAVVQSSRGSCADLRPLMLSDHAPVACWRIDEPATTDLHQRQDRCGGLTRRAYLLVLGCITRESGGARVYDTDLSCGLRDSWAGEASRRIRQSNVETTWALGPTSSSYLTS